VKSQRGGVYLLGGAFEGGSAIELGGAMDTKALGDTTGYKTLAREEEGWSRSVFVLSFKSV